MFKKFATAFAILVISSQAQARGLDLKLADKMAELTYFTESSTFGYGGADIGLGALFTENDNNNGNDYQINGQIMITGNPAGNNKALQFGVGGKLIATHIDVADDTVGALALSGQIRYVIPSSTPIAFLAAGHFAPGITSFSGADQYFEYRFAIELEVTPSARAYIGYRKIEYEFENGGEYEVDDGAHLGVKFNF